MNQSQIIYLQNNQFPNVDNSSYFQNQRQQSNSISLQDILSESQIEQIQIQDKQTPQHKQNMFFQDNQLFYQEYQVNDNFNAQQGREIEFINQQKKELEYHKQKQKQCCQKVINFFKLVITSIKQKYKQIMNTKKIIREFQSQLVLSQINDLINNNLLDSQLNITFQKKSIIIIGPEAIVNKNQKILDNQIKIQNNNLKYEYYQMYQKIWDYLNKYQQKELNIIQSQNQSTIDLKILNKIAEQDIVNLRFSNKTLVIRFGDIAKQKCDAIVNSCDENLNLGKINNLTGVAAAIIEFGGQPYKNHLNQLINRNGNLKEADLYKVANSKIIKNIISVPTKNYSISDNNIEQFKTHIKSVFRIANQQKLKILVIPILGGGSAGYFFKTVSNIILNEILVQMQIFQNIDNVVIIENKQVKVDILVNQLKQLLNPPQIRQMKYQWQWQDNGWKDYDDIEINQTIDASYEQYLNNNNQNEIQIIFPFTKLPGTHAVDLKNMTVTDISTNQINKISVDKSQGRCIYKFNGEPIHESLNEYIELQKLSNLLQFQIFFKRHKVVFSKQKIIQINEKTNYEREVRFQIYKKQQIQINKCPLNSQFQFNELIKIQDFQALKISQDQINLVIQSLQQRNIEKTKQSLQNLIDTITTTIKWDVINLDDQIYIQVEQEINKRSIYYKGTIGAGNQIEIHCIKSKAQKLQNYFQSLEKYSQIYPKTWIPQNINMIKVELSQNDEEYKKVSKLFNDSYKLGKIYQINRIQNKVLYENFSNEKQKLIKFRQCQGQQLNQMELERYVWHGVLKQNPQIIYSGYKEAFDCSYSQNGGMWGPGIYFAENSIYSKEYSYTLKSGDSQQFKGKLIFLLCLVATGKLIKLDSDNSLKRPPDGYDCVQGQTGGSDIFILYQMDVRRAYPAYEVIYE